MKFDEIGTYEKEILRLGEESDVYLRQQPVGEDHLNERSLFYSRLIKTIVFFWLSIFFVVLANAITLTRPLGEPYLTTQDGLIIKINDYKRVGR